MSACFAFQCWVRLADGERVLVLWDCFGSLIVTLLLWNVSLVKVPKLVKVGPERSERFTRFDIFLVVADLLNRMNADPRSLT